MAFVETLLFLLPASRAKNWVLRRLGHLISPDARISPILALGVSHFEVGPQSSIGPFNVFRDLSLVKIGKCALIGQWNWISAARPLVELGAPGEIHIADHAAITSRHYLDASGGIRIEKFATVAGVRSTFITHGIDTLGGEQSFEGIQIGEYSLVSSNVRVVPGGVVPNRVVVGMGAVVTRGAAQEGSLYLGVPARPCKHVDGRYFSRPSGPVDLPSARDTR